MESPVVEIKILKEFPFFGEGDSLENRLRKVSLKGFPDVKIYKYAEFSASFLRPEQIEYELHTPQPSVYQNNLDRIKALNNLFKEKGINILNLERAYDFVARSANGEEKEWTMIPPIVEEWTIPHTSDGSIDYTTLLSDDLVRNLRSQSLWLNPDLSKIKNTSKAGVYLLINDGIHRIHFGLLNNGIKVLQIRNITPGYPYYAAPQPYSTVQIMSTEPNEKTTNTKVHIVQSPGQKALYRSFPSGGIMTGEVRPPTEGEVFL